MKTSFKSLAIGAVLALGVAGGAMAQNAPGDIISNTIDMSYTSGGSTINAPAAASVDFTVDRKIDLLVQGLNAGGLATVDPDQNGATLSYLVQNLGNGTNGFDIDIAPSGTLGLVYSPTGPGGDGTFYTVISDSPTPGLGTETPYDATGVVNVGNTVSGGTFYVHVYADIQPGATDLQSTDILLTSQALDAGTNSVTTELTGQGLNAVDVVFTDPGLDNSESATQTYQVATSVLTATKTVAVISENRLGGFDCATGAAVVGAEAAIPGACLEYTITVTNATGASSAATNLTITDVIASTLSYESVNAGTFSTVSYDVPSTTVTGNVTSLAAGASASFTVRATVGN